MPPNEDQDRLRKLEEAHGFAERAVEELSQEVRDLGRKLHELATRLARLEAKMAEDRESEPSDEQ